ncbi:MAG: TrkH family potassium uptake protein [Clostridia bacterium]|nr:TrkH family potassium uptake protein [Clostridia bacterium]
MNKRLTFKLIGNVLLIESILLVVSLVVSLLTGGTDAIALLISAVITAAAGFVLSRLKPKNDNLRAREGFAVCALTWVLVSFFGALPFWFYGSIPSFIDAYFEVVSGFTTTGATILTDVEALPKGLLFWRSFTHWAGGMGVLVLSLALIPKMGARSIHLMRAESPGPSVDKLVPRVGNNAKILYLLYIGLSVLMLICLLLTGMSLYDALIHTFGAAGTGGFSNYNASVAHFDSAAVDFIIALFMMFFGVNFSMYYFLLKRNWRSLLHNSELKAYLGAILFSTVAIAFNIVNRYEGNFLTALRYSFFQVSSIMTSTGYATADFNQWAHFSRTLLVILMFIGASAGSTGGGIKVVRIQLLFKVMVREIRHTIHPKSVNAVKMDGRQVSDSVIAGVLSFFSAYMLILMIATLIVSLDGYSFETTFTAVIATLSNIGPGLGMVGPTGNFSHFSDLSKIVLTLCMLIGRLEIFPMLMLFVPSAWRRD